MYEYTGKNVIYILCFLTAVWPEVGRSDGSNIHMEVTGVTGVVTNLNVTDKILDVNYQIRNGSNQDVWLCEFISRFMVCERYMDKDSQSLMLRRRLRVPMNTAPGEQPIGRYLRLRSGESRTESLSLSLPVSRSSQFASLQILPDIVYATRLIIEIGYYAEDLPEMIFNILEQAENNDTMPYVCPTQWDGRTVRDWLMGSLTFNEINERLRDRNEEVVIPWINQTLEGEQTLRIIVNDLNIPYRQKLQSPEYDPPDLTTCTKVEIHYQPSMLEYFFPYAAQQSLLSPAEMQYLRSLENIEVSEKQYLKIFANEVSRGFADGFAVTEGRSARVVCYRNSDRLTSFGVYDDSFVETEDKQRFRYQEGWQGLKILTPQMKPFEFRVRCANNIKNLWHRLRLYHKAEKLREKKSLGGSEMLYPLSADWCDAMVPAYRSIGMLDKFILKPHICPAVGEGKNHYAINPHCKPDSPADMVLLFETKAGWNQHGGPELFTFDNHDPKGGCVLLNDGTVKFIRTKEELQQLRWK